MRSHNELAHQSLQCLAQLASLSGSIFPDERSRDEYFQFFVVNFMDLFQEYEKNRYLFLNLELYLEILILIFAVFHQLMKL